MTNFPHILVGTLNLTSDFTFIYQGQRTGGRGWLWRWWECLWWGQFRKKRIESRRRGWRERDIFPSTSLHAEIRQGLGHFVGRTLGSCHQSGGEFLTLLLYRVDVLVYILKDSLGLFVYFRGAQLKSNGGAKKFHQYSRSKWYVFTQSKDAIIKKTC